MHARVYIRVYEKTFQNVVTLVRLSQKWKVWEKWKKISSDMCEKKLKKLAAEL